jgi:hypothetical protein
VNPIDKTWGDTRKWLLNFLSVLNAHFGELTFNQLTGMLNNGQARVARSTQQ